MSSLSKVAAVICALATPAYAHADSIVFDSLGSGELLGALAVTGSSPSNRDLGSRFVPDRDYLLSSIELNLRYEGVGLNEGDVWLMSDRNGLPDERLESFHFSGSPRDSPTTFNETVTATSALRPSLTAGVPYWIVASADGETYLSFGVNSLGHTGVAVRLEDGPWFFNPDQAVAFRVTGELSPVPEPGSLTLLGIGMAMYAWTARRRTVISSDRLDT